MTGITGESTPVARRDLATVEVEGELVLYDDSNRRLHRLNRTAAVLWACLDGSGSLNQIADDIAEAFQADPHTVLAQIVEMAEQFASEGLLEGTEPPGQVKWRNPEPGPFVDEPLSPCMDPKFDLGPEGSMTVRVGPRFIGLRANVRHVAASARVVLAPSLVDGVISPSNVSIVETAARAGRSQYWCYRSGLLAARARSIQGAIRVAVALLGAYERPDIPCVLLDAVAAVKDGEAVLASSQSRYRVPGLEARLRSDGWSLNDSPWVHLDPTTGDLLVPPNPVAIDEAALLSLPADPLDGSAISAGRYPVNAWVAVPRQAIDDSGIAGRLIEVATESPDLHRDPRMVFGAASILLKRTAWRVATTFNPTAFVRLFGDEAVAVP